MRVAVRMLDTITDLTRGLDPVLRCVQILPFAVGVILQVVKRGVRLGFDLDRVLSVCERCGGHQCEKHDDAEQQGNEFLGCFHTCPFLWVIK